MYLLLTVPCYKLEVLTPVLFLLKWIIKKLLYVMEVDKKNLQNASITTEDLQG